MEKKLRLDKKKYIKGKVAKARIVFSKTKLE